MVEIEKRFKELEDWINAYDLPVDRACVADIFYDLTGEIKFWKAKAEQYEKALKEIAETKEDISCNEIALKYEVIADKALSE